MCSTRRLYSDHKSGRITSFYIVLIATGLSLTLFGAFGQRQTIGAVGLSSSALLYLSPTNSTLKVGDSFTMSVRENSGYNPVNAVQAIITYPQNLLQLDSFSTSGSAFNINANSAAEGNVVTIDVGSIKSLTEDQLVANLIFQVISNGNASPSLAPVCKSSTTINCSAIINSTNAINIALVDPNISPIYVLQSAGNENTFTITNLVTSPPGSQITFKTSITPSGRVIPSIASDNATIKVGVPIAIQPATIQEQGVKQVNYYLNNKLVYTSQTPPFTYHLNTTKLLNGRYSLTSKIIYLTGQTKTSSQILAVSNPMSWSQLELQVRHYLWILLLIIVICVVGFAVLMSDRKRKLQPPVKQKKTKAKHQPEPAIITPPHS
jgi:hypothetical protein